MPKSPLSLGILSAMYCWPAKRVVEVDAASEAAPILVVSILASLAKRVVVPAASALVPMRVRASESLPNSVAFALVSAEVPTLVVSIEASRAKRVVVPAASALVPILVNMVVWLAAVASPKAVESSPSRRSAFRLVTLVIEATTSGAVPVVKVDSICEAATMALSQPEPMLMAYSVPAPPVIAGIFRPYSVMVEAAVEPLTAKPLQVQAPVAQPVKAGAATLTALIDLVPAPEVLTVEAMFKPLVTPPLLAFVEASVKVIEDSEPTLLSAVCT